MSMPQPRVRARRLGGVIILAALAALMAMLAPVAPVRRAGAQSGSAYYGPTLQTRTGYVSASGLAVNENGQHEIVGLDSAGKVVAGPHPVPKGGRFLSGRVLNGYRDAWLSAKAHEEAATGRPDATLSLTKSQYESQTQCSPPGVRPGLRADSKYVLIRRAATGLSACEGLVLAESPFAVSDITLQDGDGYLLDASGAITQQLVATGSTVTFVYKVGYAKHFIERNGTLTPSECPPARSELPVQLAELYRFTACRPTLMEQVYAPLWGVVVSTTDSLSIQQQEKQRQTIYQAQTQIGNKMQVLAKEGEEGRLRGRYVQQLNRQEEQLADIDRFIADTRQEIQRKNSDLDQLLGRLK